MESFEKAMAWEANRIRVLTAGCLLLRDIPPNPTAEETEVIAITMGMLLRASQMSDRNAALLMFRQAGPGLS